MPRVSEIGGKRVPLLRWSFLRMLMRMKRLTTEWQVGGERGEVGEHLSQITGPLGYIEITTSAEA